MSSESDWSAIPAEDQRVYEAAGYGQQIELESDPALIVVDVTVNFTGDRSEPILESIKRFKDSCGEAAWESLDAIRKLQLAFRSLNRPVVMTRAPSKSLHNLGGWSRTSSRATEVLGEDPGERFLDIIAPLDADIVLEKSKPSVFFGTALVSILHELQVNTLIVCGATTSGCVRATVVDAFSYGYRVGVVREATFDRGVVPHAVNLFDMDQKYANVMSLEAVLSFVLNLGPR